MQAQTQAIKKQFEEAVDKLTKVSNKIEEAEAEIERTHAFAKLRVSEPPPLQNEGRGSCRVYDATACTS